MEHGMFAQKFVFRLYVAMFIASVLIISAVHLSIFLLVLFLVFQLSWRHPTQLHLLQFVVQVRGQVFNALNLEKHFLARDEILLVVEHSRLLFSLPKRMN